MKVAVIPARGGSKRIPRKNIRDFLGKPMVAYPLAVLQQANCFDHILASTGDDEIAAIAETDLPDSNFSDVCSFSLEEIVNPYFCPAEKELFCY